MVKDYGAADLQPKTETCYDSSKKKFHFTIMSTEELKVMLQAVFTTTSENYGPKNFFRSPIQARSWLSDLNCDKRFFEDDLLQGLHPLCNYEMNSLTAFRRHCVEKGESYYFQEQLAMTAETDGGIQVYYINNVQQPCMYYEGALGYGAKDCS